MDNVGIGSAVFYFLSSIINKARLHLKIDNREWNVAELSGYL